MDFGFLFVLAGILGKFIGCGVTSKLCGFNLKESCSIGIGMMVRAEVALVCMQKGVDAGIISSSISAFVVMLILITSLTAPILLKLLNQKKLSLNNELVEEAVAKNQENIEG